jgi:hypothetical protein
MTYSNYTYIYNKNMSFDIVIPVGPNDYYVIIETI